MIDTKPSGDAPDDGPDAAELIAIVLGTSREAPAKQADDEADCG